MHRRATYKAEESITQLEGGKRLQDEMIDKLNEQLKRSQEELALNEAQLIAQRGEAGAADQTLRDAWQEMEAINYEKKQLLAQWKSALLGMQRRDEALQATENALHKQREQEQAIEGEAGEGEAQAEAQAKAQAEAQAEAQGVAQDGLDRTGDLVEIDLAEQKGAGVGPGAPQRSGSGSGSGSG